MKNVVLWTVLSTVCLGIILKKTCPLSRQFNLTSALRDDFKIRKLTLEIPFKPYILLNENHKICISMYYTDRDVEFRKITFGKLSESNLK